MKASVATVLAGLFAVVTAQQQPDGTIVPFAQLPACASLCGPLFDVQGACSPPHIDAVSQSCFCSDPRLTPFTQGYAEVESVCGAASCQDTSDLVALQNWYETYCGQIPAATTTSTSSSSTGTSGSSHKGGSSSNSNQSWFSTHWKWVVMLIILILLIVGTWVGACVLRKRHLKKVEKEIEMRPPVAWGPHQMQASTGGYGSSGLLDMNAAKEAQVADLDSPGGKRLSRGWR